MLKFAFRNLKSKPWRMLAIMFGIAVAVAMIFAMLSFRGAVYDYISATETAVAGSSDIKIATQSSSDRITTVTADLKNLDGVKTVVTSLYLYAELGGEYVQARGLDGAQLETLQKIDVARGNVSQLSVDDVVISEKAAEHFGVKVGDKLELSLGSNSRSVYVGAVAKNTGYFLDDAPYLILGNIKIISGLVVPGESSLCNEIYLLTESGADNEQIVSAIKGIETYKDMQVGLSHDYKYIDEQTSSLTAPVVLAGAAVLVLAVVIVAFLFLMGEKDKIDYIARLKIVGATNGQIFGIFMIESAILAFVGALVGSALAVGVFALIIRLTLKIAITNVSVLYLFLAAVIGISAGMASSVVPIVRSMRSTIRQSQTQVQKKSKYGFVLPVLLALLATGSLLIECLVESVTGYFAVLSLVLLFATLFFAAPYVLRGASRLVALSKNPSVKTAAKTLPREKRFARSSSILSVGMVVSVMLFMAWNITSTVFDGYIKNFENFVFVSNIKSSVNANDFKVVEGVEAATKMVWGKSEISGDGFEKTVNLLGSGDIIDMVNFEFITPKDEVKTSFAPKEAGKDYTDEAVCLVDISLQKLYGLQVGDMIDISIKDVNAKAKVVGILKHTLFNGNYIVMSSEALAKLGADVDTVLVVASGDVKETVGNVKAKYASQNYYVVDALEAYKWDKESTSAVFDLVGTLAVVVGIFILIVSVFAALVGRSAEERARTVMLSAGMSKGGMLALETTQHTLIALTSFVLSFAFSALLTMSLIHALALFGLYFEFVYSAWVVAVVGIVMALAYSVVPLVLGFKRGYKLGRN
ncbi:MAG: ABC transporter permease [Clostridia bacterium]|nr:ABC transporter permease [Clostridia bacterium]